MIIDFPGEAIKRMGTARFAQVAKFAKKHFWKAGKKLLSKRLPHPKG
ncbi:hypothetical protein [Desulfonatronum parangueonense]